MSERIWAPWRMQYIRAPKAAATGCVLCGHAQKEPERESAVLARWPRSYVVLNRYPYAAGHLMVVPVAHVADPKDLDAAAHDELFRLVTASASRLRTALGADGVNVGINLGEAAGAGIAAHLHVHVVPRFCGDNNFMPVLADVRVLPEYLSDTWDFLAPHFRAAVAEDRP